MFLCVPCGLEFFRHPSGGSDVYGRQETRLLTSFGQLLERIRDLKQGRLAPGASKERDADRQSPEVSRRDINIGIAGDGSGARTASGGVIAIDQIGDPSGASGGSEERVEFE